ncbi:MAG: hypothetical protein LBV67_00180 [Streptococcaceae bacterium]|nr:hypothetical protein [Streptococcaceae bacterium]
MENPMERSQTVAGQTTTTKKPDLVISQKGKTKFIIGAIVGAFLFLMPIPVGDGVFNIPLGVAISWLNGVMHVGDTDIRVWLAYSFIIISFLLTIVGYIFKPKFIMNNEALKEVSLTSPLYAVTRLIAFVVMTMNLFSLSFGSFDAEGNPANFLGRLSYFITHPWDGGGLMVFELITGLTTIFLLLAFCIPLLTEFGLMEFIGVLIKKFVNKLFTLPGRASVDLAASWFGSSAVSVMLTRTQHEKGYYTGREAATISANFAFVSLPFSLVIAQTVGVESHFALWYLMVSVVCIILGIITPRIWPLRNLPDNYVLGVEKAIDEEVEEGQSRFKKALFLASERAAITKPSHIIKGGLSGWMGAFFDLFPVIVAWGTVALILHGMTPFIDLLSRPMGMFLELLQVPGGAEYAPITVIGFIDMFLPAIFLGSETYFNTRFILSALSIVQIIYMAETGVLILKSKMPLGLGKLFIVFIMRTILALPLIVLLTHIFTMIGLL